MTFGEYVKVRRTELGFTLRQFAAAKGYDVAYISRIENGILSAPADQDKTKALAVALNLAPRSVEWVEFFDMAAASRNEIPEDLKNNPFVPRLMPAFYRTLRQGKISDEEIKELVDLLKSESLQD
jgi:transcriptional regulator with XRE-family HTH domain